MTEIPHGDDNFDLRILKIAIVPKGQPIFSEQATMIEITDEAAGEFIVVSQNGGHTDLEKKIAIEVKEWILLREAIAYMISQCN